MNYVTTAQISREKDRHSLEEFSAGPAIEDPNLSPILSAVTALGTVSFAGLA